MYIEIKLGDTREREVTYSAGMTVRYGDRDVYFQEDTIVPVTECYKTDRLNYNIRSWEIIVYHLDQARPAHPPLPPKGPGWFSSLWSWLFGDPQIPPSRVVKDRSP